MGVGEQLVLYTDGVTEARSSSGRFGEERLRERLREVKGPAEAVRRIDTDLEEFCGGNVNDDAAFLAVMRTEPLPAGVSLPSGGALGQCLSSGFAGREKG